MADAPEQIEAHLQAVRAGRAIALSRDVYGSGREHETLSFDPARDAYVLEERFQDMNGGEHGGVSVVSEERARDWIRKMPSWQ